MVHGVVTYDMSLVHHSPHQVGVFLYVIAYQKKCRRRVVLFQYIQNLFRRAVFVAGVKGQIYDLLGSVP